MNRRALAALLAAALGACTSKPPIAPKPATPLASSGTPGIEVLSWDRTLDLTRWEFVPEDRAHDKVSAVVWHDHLTVRRSTADATVLHIRNVTTGAPAPEVSSVTHRFTVSDVGLVPQGAGKPDLHAFDARLDISGEPVGQWFEADVRALCWNSLNDEDEGWAALAIVDPTAHAAFEVDLPADRAARNWERREGSRGATGNRIVTDDHVLVSDRKTSLRWTIDTPQLDGVYLVSWEW